MHLTRESEYALRGMVVLATRPTRAPLTLGEIAKADGLPHTFLAKIFQKLARHGLVLAARGPGRGYALAKPASVITIYEVLESVEGPRLNQRCLLWNRRCAEIQPCPLHRHVRALLPKLDWTLRQISLAEYAGELVAAEPDSVDRSADRWAMSQGEMSSPLSLHTPSPISEHSGAQR